MCATARPPKPLTSCLACRRARLHANHLCEALIDWRSLHVSCVGVLAPVAAESRLSGLCRSTRSVEPLTRAGQIVLLPRLSRPSQLFNAGSFLIYGLVKTPMCC